MNRELSVFWPFHGFFSPNGSSVREAVHPLFGTFVMPNHVEWNANNLNAIPARGQGGPFLECGLDVDYEPSGGILQAYRQPDGQIYDTQ